MKAVLARIREVAAAHEMEKQRRLWLPELPENLYLYGLRTFRRPSDDGKSYPNPQGNIRLLAGLADDVDNQLYLPYVVDLTEARNLIVVGLAGTGKTTLVQSMVYSLCNTYDPSRLNIYILSLTSQTLGNLVSFPQVGDVVFDGEKAEARRLLNMLEAELERRAELFAAASTDSFQAYNAARLKRGAAPEPAIVVFVDRCAQLFELFAGDEPNLERIKTLFQEGSGRGIHFVLTAMAMNELPSRLRIFFSGAALQLKDRADYSECINHRVPYDMQAIANLPGRGMGVIDNKVYEIQFALGGDAPIHEGEGFDSFENSRMYDDVVKQEQDAPEVAPSSDVERAEKIVHCARGQDAAWTGSRPARVPRIPKEPDWQTLFAEPDFEAQVRTDFGLPLGYDMERGGVASIETSGAPGWMVFGPPRSGVSNFLS